MNFALGSDLLPPGTRDESVMGEELRHVALPGQQLGSKPICSHR